MKDRRTDVQQALFERREAQAREREAAKGTARKKVLTAEERTYEGLDKLFAAIDARREPELDRFIFALGIRHIGETTAGGAGPHLLDHRGTDPRRQGDCRRRGSAYRVSVRHGIGDTVIGALLRFFGNERNDEVLDALLAQVHPKPYVVTVSADSVVAGKPWCSPAR